MTFTTQHLKEQVCVQVHKHTNIIYMTPEFSSNCLVLSCFVFFRTALSEKKAVLKPKSPEKSKPDEKDVEKSPAKKTEGLLNSPQTYCTEK